MLSDSLVAGFRKLVLSNEFQAMASDNNNYKMVLQLLVRSCFVVDSTGFILRGL